MTLTVRDFKGCHAGETMLVLGLGPSLGWLPETNLWTIGVNDIWAHWSVPYVVVGDAPERFTSERRRTIATAQPEAFFMPKGTEQLWREDPRFFHPCVIEFGVDRVRWEKGFDPNPDHLYASAESSISYAIGLATYMGAKCIGLVGVDYTEHMQKRVKIAEPVFKAHYEICKELGCTLFNLSMDSNITTVPKIPLREFIL